MPQLIDEGGFIDVDSFPIYEAGRNMFDEVQRSLLGT